MSEVFHDPLVIDGRYRLDVQLGAGAFGSVHKATQMVLGKDMRSVALKLFHKDRVKLENIEQMMNEAIQILALLADLTDWEIRQHFVTVYDLGVTRETQPRGYVAMELVRGGSLEQRIRDYRKFTVKGTYHYLLQIARAVAFMHRNGRVHSDLKPANVLVFSGRDQDLVKIGDFGLAGKYRGPFGSGPAGGTISYLPLENLSGLANSPAADVFSMGVMTYEMLTGANPYNEVGHTLDPNATDHEQVFREMQVQARQEALVLRQEDFPELAAGGPLVHLAPLVDVINRMLEPSPAERYPTADAVLTDLLRIGAGRLPAPRDSARPAAAPADPADLLAEKFAYYLDHKKWSEADTAAAEVIRLKPQDALGYVLRSKIPLKHAERLRSGGEGARADRAARQALAILSQALSQCDSESRRQVQQEMANVFQILGDDQTAREYRRMSALSGRKTP